MPMTLKLVKLEGARDSVLLTVGLSQGAVLRQPEPVPISIGRSASPTRQGSQSRPQLGTFHFFWAKRRTRRRTVFEGPPRFQAVL